MTSFTAADLERMARERADATQRIVGSPARRKLVVAGPGTGKSHTFRKALETATGRGLAVTFIRNLVRDLRTDLSDIAEVYTFHGLCKQLLHRFHVEGLTPRFDFYPALLALIAQDLELLGRSDASEKEIVRAFHYLDDSKGLVSASIACGNYYDATSFVDVVYRGLRHLQSSPTSTPSYPLVVVDEYQDFSLLETTFIGELARVSPVLIAGDDDQALYAFKHASASYIRELAVDPTYAHFGLPYCSRCTEVIVQAVKAVVGRAKTAGMLHGRLDRQFECYLPDKQIDSAQHPTIIHAHCSVETKAAPYLCRYVSDEIARIPASDIHDSHEKRIPTALVIGPMHFVERVHAHLVASQFPNAVLRKSATTPLDLLDGYSRLAQDRGSRLGWRLITHFCPFPDRDNILLAVLDAQGALDAALPTAYRAQHLALVDLVERLSRGEPLAPSERAQLESALARPVEDVAAALSSTPEDDAQQEPAPNPAVPKIVCTSLVGAKGLSASHVFLVGFNDGHFPQHPASITDEEVCCFIVGLSRTRKACHLVSCGRFAAQARLKPSTLLRWIESFTETRKVNKDYWSGR